jgi:hypothetical protein
MATRGPGSTRRRGAVLEGIPLGSPYILLDQEFKGKLP